MPRGFGGENPEVTLEQVCRALNEICRTLFRRRRGDTDLGNTGEIIRYHQRRNKIAADGRKKQRHKSVL